MNATRRNLLFAVTAAALLAAPAEAHPGSGIVADRQGRIYFIDTGAGIWKVDTRGVLSRVPGPAFHWITMDPGSRFGKTRMPSGSGWEIRREGTDPTLLVSSDFPIAIGGDGNLYYPTPSRDGGAQVLKLTPTGQSSVLATLSVPYVNGLAAGPDDSLYATENNAIRRIDAQGRVSTIVADVALPGCASIPGVAASERPFFRGLDVDSRGTIVVAAAGCGSVLTVTPDGKVGSLLQLRAPWSPTAVARVGADVYVLEYLHTTTEDRSAWLPRVRKISPDGRTAILATVDRR